MVSTEGVVVCEIASHSRQINAICSHPSKSVFASCSDDTFMNVYEVSGDKIEKLDVNLIIASKVNDYMLTGVCFGGAGNNSIIAVPYDFKTCVVWNNIV